MKMIFSAMFVISIVMSSSAALAKGQLSQGIKKQRQCREQAVEIARHLSLDFSTIDENSDGQLTRNETGSKIARQACFKHLDRNRDGKLSEAELLRFS